MHEPEPLVLRDLKTNIFCCSNKANTAEQKEPLSLSNPEENIGVLSLGVGRLSSTALTASYLAGGSPSAFLKTFS